jgi:carboxypeptidase C (cathepsin A)
MADNPQHPADQPLIDTTPYGSGPDASVSDTTEQAAVTHHVATIDGKTIPYTARVGHLVTVESSTARPNAKFFYVSFTVDGRDQAARPVSFFYNGGPGSSAVFLLLGSFAPRRIKTSLPDFTPPPPYTIEDNPDSLLDRSDLVFINPIGTGYSAAVAPHTNREFWGVDEDARSIKDFIKRYLTVYDRWNSPRFLFGESYGTARSCVLAWLLHEDGVDLNGITLQSSILDYAQTGNAVGLLPTLAADAWYHRKVTLTPPPPDLPAFMQTVTAFAAGPYGPAKSAFPKIDQDVLKTLSAILGISPVVLISWGLDVSAGNSIGLLFLSALLQDQGLALGGYDGRATAIDTGIAASIDPASGGNDPTMTAVGGVYTAMWNTYLNDELKYVSISPFTDLNDQTFRFWNFAHVDPTGAQKGKDVNGNVVLYTAGDLAATMALNPDLKVFSANGFYDSVTPFYQTAMTLAAMPLANAAVRANITVRNYPSGHMVYLDGPSRTAMKADLSVFYDSATTRFVTRQRLAHQLQFCRPYVKFPSGGDGVLTPRTQPAQVWRVPDLCRAYDWPTGLAGGGVIGIVELGGGWIAGDMEQFFRAIGQDAPSIVDVSVNGGRNAPSQPGGDPGLLGRQRPKRDRGRNPGRGRRWLRHLLDLLGRRRGDLAECLAATRARSRGGARQCRAGGDQGRDGDLRRGRRQRFERRRPGPRQRRPAVELSPHRGLRRYSQKPRRRNRLERGPRQSERSRHRRGLLKPLSSATLAGRGAARSGTHGAGRRCERRPEYWLRGRHTRGGHGRGRHQRGCAALRGAVRRLRP